MKKLLVTLAAVLVSASTFAQGTISFNNRTAAGDIPVRRPDGTGAGAGITAQLVLVGAGGAITPLTPTTTFRTSSPAAAFFVNAIDVAVPGIAAGSPATVRLRAWEGANFDSSLLRIESADLTTGPLGGISPAGIPFTPPDLSGLSPNPLVLQVIPEPSTMALGLLGAAALLYRRRK